MKRKTDPLDSVAEGEENFVGDSEIIALGGASNEEGEENFVGDSEIIALGGASNETKDRPLG